MSQQKEGFLPDDYEEPVTSGYMKFEEGQNRFRVLPAKEGKQTVILGWEYWKTNAKGERKPIRVRKDVSVPMGELETNPRTGDLDTPKFFWAFAVWNYKANRIQILELKQKTIRQAIENLSRNPKWGSPTEYDLIIDQVVEGPKTSYSVTPDPKEAIDPEILKVYEATYLNLDALYDGKDPYTKDENESLETTETSVSE